MADKKKEPKSKTTGTFLKVQDGKLSDADIDKALDALFGPEDPEEEKRKQEQEKKPK